MMRSIGLIGSLAALIVSAPVAAQRLEFRTDDSIQSGRRPVTVNGQKSRADDRIPPGQRPPAGMCRIWIDGVPPGQQPASTDCQTAVATKPANARVIWGDQTPFPGKGKDKARKDGRVDDDDDETESNSAKKSDRRDDDDKKLKKNKDRQDRDDDDQPDVRSSRWPVVNGTATPTTSGLKSANKGHGRGHK